MRKTGSAIALLCHNVAPPLISGQQLIALQMVGNYAVLGIIY